MSRANQIICELDQLSQELKDLANNPRAKEAVEHLRITLGLEKGGYVGQANLSELIDEGEFEEQEEEEDDEPCPECLERGCNGECTGHGQMGD